ncbi:MAG TPA: D-TA family PLP-dependent enzyme, partial [Clostridia bacterium]|nr:D-TA family PLP-dependent enzyme [Clostridia bacterium]
MKTDRYGLENAESIVSPALVYYKDILENNVKLAIAMAGGARRLWPHIKTHKSADVV